MGDVRFDGLGPYAMPVSQSATAKAVGTTVEASLRLLVHPNQLEVVHVPMTLDMALELANALTLAARDALNNRGGRLP